MFVTNWISTTKIQKISEITNFFRHYFLSRTEVSKEKSPRFSMSSPHKDVAKVSTCFLRPNNSTRQIYLDKY